MSNYTPSTIANIPIDTVGIDYAMDPLEEDVIYGSSLKEGMVVLIEERVLRENPIHRNIDLRSQAHAQARIDETSRWCKVTNLRHDGRIVQFIGLYGDGTKRSRSYHEDYCWFIKVL